MHNPSINRSLKDKEMNRIDHALGRPFDPTLETFRSYFGICGKNPDRKYFENSEYWSEGHTMGDSTMFYVTEAGRKALKKHLKSIGSKYRLFDVTFNGYTDTVVSTSHSKARYEKYLDVSDCYDVSFCDFCKESRVVLAGKS